MTVFFWGGAIPPSVINCLLPTLNVFLKRALLVCSAKALRSSHCGGGEDSNEKWRDGSFDRRGGAFLVRLICSYFSTPGSARTHPHPGRAQIMKRSQSQADSCTLETLLDKDASKPPAAKKTPCSKTFPLFQPETKDFDEVGGKSRSALGFENDPRTLLFAYDRYFDHPRKLNTRASCTPRASCCQAKWRSFCWIPKHKGDTFLRGDSN